MKMKLSVRKARYDTLAQELLEHGIEVDEASDLVLMECGSLMVRAQDSNDRVQLSSEEIIYMESFGHTVCVYTDQEVYKLNESLYKILERLNPEQFLRINHSTIVARNKIQKISTTLSMKFILTMEGGVRLDVTRSYYYLFKEAFGI